MTPPVRKPHRYGGLQVRVCGRTLGIPTAICCLPPDHRKNGSKCAAIAIGEDGSVVAVIQSDGKEVEAWQLAGPPE
jgi:hypothetical protein